MRDWYVRWWDEMSLSIELRGALEVQKAAEETVRQLRGPHFLMGLRQAVLLVERHAKLNATESVDTGALRASITPEIRVEGEGTIVGVVGSNLEYAPFVEFSCRAHWPPPGALARWAERHDMDEYLVARAISRRGTKGTHFLENAFRDHEDEILHILWETVEGIIQSDWVGAGK